MDAGSEMVGFSALFNTGKLILEILAAVAQLRNDMVKQLSDRRANRGDRRNKKKRYRQARFNNHV